jgi:hypothetical protein
MVLPRELLSVADLDLVLTDEQWAVLSREELASILDAGVRFESVLMAGFGFMLAWQKDLVDPRVTYVLHELGEETRHSRLFVRVIEQLSPTAVNPFTGGIYSRLDHYITARAITRKALFCVLVLTGEEAPDLIQKKSSEHPDTDPYVRATSTATIAWRKLGTWLSREPSSPNCGRKPQPSSALSYATLGRSS